MKRLSKILMLVLVVALTLGCVFVIAASAADLPAGVTTSGSSNYTTGYEGFRSDKSNMGIGSLAAITAPDGNTYAEWIDLNPSANDTASYDYNLRNLATVAFRDTSYYILEMDIASKTQLPEGFAYRWEASTYNADYTANNGGNSGNGYITFFVVTGGKITFDDGTQVVPQEGNDWIHLTFIIKTNVTQQEVVLDETAGTTVTYDDYSKAQLNAYADGKLVYATDRVNNNDLADGTFKRDRFGFLYNITNACTNPAGQSIAWDNWYVTRASAKGDSVYQDSGDAYLGQLFNGTVTDLTDYAGNEVRYNKDGYTYPANLATAQVTKTTNKGVTTTVGSYKTLAEAIEAACEMKTNDARSTYDVYLLNDDGYVKSDVAYTLPAGNVTRAINLHTNGKAFAEPTVGGIAQAAVVTGEGEATVYTYAESTDYVTFLYYTEGTIDEAIAGDTNYAKLENVVTGVAPVAPTVESVYDAENNTFIVFEGWEYYTVDWDTETYESLGTTCPEVTEDMYGSEIYVIAKTREAAPLFEVGGTKYVDNSDFTAANLNGKTVKLLGDVKLVDTLSNVKVDLNGYTLDCGATNLVNGNGATSFFYSSSEGGKILSTGTLHATDQGDFLYLGYSDASTTSACRITLVVGLIAPTRNDKTYMYGCDVITTAAWPGANQGGALFYNQQARTKIVRIDNCNFYCAVNTQIFSAHKTSQFDAVVTNTNFYGQGQLICAKLYNDNALADGTMVINLENVHTYGDFKVATGHKLFQVVVGAGCSFSNYSEDAIKSIADGYVLFPSTEKVTLADVTYVTTIGGETLTFVGGEFAVGNAVIVEPPKTVVTVYDKVYGVEGATGTEMNAYVGYAPAFPVIGTYMEGNTMYKPTNNYVLYNANNEQVGTLAIGAEWTQALVDAGAVAAYPEVEVVQVAFAIVGADGALDYKAAYELTNANVTGKTVKLLADVTMVEKLSGVTIDLNGYSLITTNLAIAFSGVTLYSSQVGGTVYCADGTGKTLSDTNVTIGETGERITLYVDRICNWGSGTATVKNCDIYNMEAHSGEKQWFGTPSWSRAQTILIDNCNIYAVANLQMVRTHKISGPNNNVTIKNTNIYGTVSIFAAPYYANATDIGSLTLENVKTYGNVTLNATGVNVVVTAGAGCYLTDNNVTCVDGYVVLAQQNTNTVSVEYPVGGVYGAETTTFDCSAFVAGYAVVVEPAKVVVNVYDKAYGDNGTATEVNAYVGYAPAFPAIGSYGDMESVSAPTGNYVLYNADGEVVGTITVGAAFTQELVDAGAVAAYPEVTKKATAFVIITGDWESFEFKAAEDFTAANVNGKFVQLISDVTVTETLSGATIDLNGNKLTVKVQLSDTGCYVYNSNTETAGTMYVGASLYGGANYRNIKIGYSAEGVKAEGRITFVAEVNNVGSTNYGTFANYYNVDFVSMGSGAWSSSLFGQLSGGAHLTAENCNFYFLNSNYMAHCSNNNGTVNFTLTNCNVYFAQGGAFMGKNYNANPANINLVNTHVYGAVSQSVTSEYYIYNIDALSTFGGTPFAKGNAGEGNVLVPIEGATAETITFAYTLADGTAETFEATLWSSAKMGTQAQLNALYATFYRNVSLDVNINFNLYVPVTVGVMDADTVKINGVDYYVVTYGQAAKDAYGDNWVGVNINGVNYAYNASLVSYVTALNNVQSTDDYVVASKKLAQYVVYYVKTAAVNANAEAVMPEAVNTILEGFALTEADTTVTGAIENVVSINGVDAATLDLDTSVGIVFKVTEGYAGKITVTFNGETVEKDYTATAAGAEEYIVISGIEVYNFTNDVVITNDAGETMTYNLATYVANKTTDIGYATYAYAVQAKAYNDVYGAAKVVD